MIENNIASVRHRVQLASTNSHRNVDSVLILAVSKTKPAEDIATAYQSGLRDFGENYVQELEAKSAALSDLNICWHFIGPLQSNKTATVASIAHWVHSVDRLKIARRLSDQRPENLEPLNVCIQVNIDREATKSGVMPEDTLALALEIATLPNIKLRGLMVIPSANVPATHTKASFARAAKLLNELKAHPLLQSSPIDTLSMGMSSDLELAIESGSTIVRVGSDLFGARN